MKDLWNALTNTNVRANLVASAVFLVVIVAVFSLIFGGINIIMFIVFTSMFGICIYGGALGGMLLAETLGLIMKNYKESKNSKKID